MKKLAAATVLLFSSMTFGGHEVGNGGDVVLCRSTSDLQPSVELLDFYEARTLRGITHTLGPANQPFLEKVETAIARLDSISPARANRYRAQASTFMSDSIFLPGVILTDVPDSANVALPVGCTIEQIAIQKEPQFPEDKRYTISKDLWDQLDEDGKAGLVLHEIIFREALGFYHETSISTRYINSYIAADKLQGLTQKDFIRFLDRAKFRETDIMGCSIETAEFRQGPHGTYASGLTFYESGTVNVAPARRGCLIDVPYISGGTAGGVGNPSAFHFHESGYLKKFGTYNAVYERGAVKFQISNHCQINLYPSRQVEVLCVGETVSLLFQDGSMKEVEKGRRVKFDENGAVISVSESSCEMRSCGDGDDNGDIEAAK
ncbi:MAG: hypothetical protein V4692_03380 [Bdellovibrionota bacterium]